MKVGVVLSLAKYRKEFIDLCENINGNNIQFVFFIKESDRFSTDKCEVRTSNYPESIKYKASKWLYAHFRKLPISRNNFHLMEFFKVKLQTKRIPPGFIFSRFLRLLFLDRFDYNTYIDLINPKFVNNAYDIDQFIFLSDISSDVLLKYAIINNKKVSILVYSWDHIYKFTKFTRNAYYFVWNNTLGNDLTRYWGVPESKISYLPPISFTSLFLFNNNSNYRTPFSQYPNCSYILYCFSTGIDSLVDQEIELVIQISNYLYLNYPNISLKVRPYPILNSWEKYKILDGISNIEILFNNKLSDEYDKVEKYIQIFNSLMVLHSGSTIGIESILIGKNAFMLNTKNVSSVFYPNLKDFILQEQNKIFYDKMCFLTKIAQIGQYIDNHSFRSFNKACQQNFSVLGPSELSNSLTRIILNHD